MLIENFNFWRCNFQCCTNCVRNKHDYTDTNIMYIEFPYAFKFTIDLFRTPIIKSSINQISHDHDRVFNHFFFKYHNFKVKAAIQVMTKKAPKLKSKAIIKREPPNRNSLFWVILMCEITIKNRWNWFRKRMFFIIQESWSYLAIWVGGQKKYFSSIYIL